MTSATKSKSKSKVGTHPRQYPSNGPWFGPLKWLLHEAFPRPTAVVNLQGFSTKDRASPGCDWVTLRIPEQDVRAVLKVVETAAPQVRAGSNGSDFLILADSDQTLRLAVRTLMLHIVNSYGPPSDFFVKASFAMPGEKLRFAGALYDFYHDGGMDVQPPAKAQH